MRFLSNALKHSHLVCILPFFLRPYHRHWCHANPTPRRRPQIQTPPLPAAWCRTLPPKPTVTRNHKVPSPPTHLHALEHRDLLAAHVEAVGLALHLALELAVHGVVLEHVRGVPAEERAAGRGRSAGLGGARAEGAHLGCVAATPQQQSRAEQSSSRPEQGLAAGCWARSARVWRRADEACKQVGICRRRGSSRPAATILTRGQ
jgi:hypothetical protein